MKKFTSTKARWITIVAIIFAWLLFHNLIIENPAIDLNLGNLETPWWIFVVLLFIVTKFLYNYKFAIVLSTLLLAIGVFGVWDEMMSTLTIIIISVFISFLVGIPTGIWMAKSSRVEKILKPILDMMQTIPSFVYLIPAVMLFSIGRVPATFATIIYAVPPLIRLTYLGINGVNQEMLEAGKSFGSTPKQLLFKIQIPQALSTIATGLNQTTMMAVAMVVIASMIGAGGLGSIVLVANRNIDIGSGFVGGFAIVFLAIILDRLLQGIASKLEENRGDA
ncbi:MAG: ABC transporter permease subunit [Firmicutes bacterium]|nr:ABC transporter permease subunit [Bacillota bacterium]